MIEVKKICEILEKEYKNAECSLNFKSDFQLLIMSRLSAQCTDIRVNKVSVELFKKFPDASSFVNADISEIEEIIKPCGLFKVKANDLKEMCTLLVNKFNSKIPYGMDNLQQLQGIGRKTANLIMSEVFHVPSIIVDTHVSRVSKRLGFHNEKSIIKIESILKEYIDEKNWSNFCHQTVFHGRKVCKARKPDCLNCCLQKYCGRCL